MRSAGKLLVLMLSLCLGLAGCANGATSSGGAGAGAAEDGLRIGLAYSVGGRGDKSFNDAAYAGVSAAADELDAEFREVSPNPDGSNRADLISQLADEGFDPIIAVGFEYSDVVAEVAPQYPDVSFAQIDGAIEDAGSPDNLTGLLFAANEGSFLGGVAAALLTETDHVGFIGGVEVPTIQEFEAGYIAGAKTVNPDIIVDVQYISPAGDFSGFNDPARGQVVAQGMYDAGADIVYAAAGGSGTGVFQAAASSGGRAIGVDSDQYQTVGDPALQAVIVTSVLKRVDNAVSEYLDALVAGEDAGGTDVVNDLSTEGVGLATSGGFIDGIQDQIDDYARRIVDGEITVPTTP